jgi:uncharacterized protein (TIGR02001 family)
MRTSFGPLLGLSLAMLATPALADEADPPKAITVNGTATVVSDYRFRGISQTDKDFALQGSITVTHKSGVYASVWGSSVDDYIAAGSDQELDLIVGFKKTVGVATVDVGALYYYYPGSSKVIAGYNSDFLELYGNVSAPIGPVTAKVSAMYAPSQKALAFTARPKEDNFYANFALSGSIPDTGIGLSAAVGRTFTKSFLSGGSKYTDWSVGATYTTGPVTFGLSYVDTSYGKNALVSLTGKDIAKAGVVGSIGVSF